MDYMVFVFFIYGLSFFNLGVTILIYPKRDSKFEVARDLWLIGAFGIAHGINEWIDMTLLLIGEGDLSTYLRAVRFLIMPVSFYFLLVFGVKVVSRRKQISIPGVLPMAVILWLLPVVTSPDPYKIGDIAGRYFLGLPGILLTAYALYSQLPEFRDDIPEVAFNLKLTSLAFVLYALFSGAIVPRGDFFPASVLNYDLFRNTFGLPVQVFRTACAVGISYHTFRTMRVFEWETTVSLQKSRDHLEQRVNERTAELKEAYDRHESYIFSVADGLRNPLQVFLGNMELIDTDGLTPDQAHAIKTSAASAELLRENILFLTDRDSIETAEMAIAESEEKYMSLFNQSSDSIFLLEPHGEKGPVIIDVNASACNLHGYTRDELLGRPISILDDPKTMEHVPDRTGQLMSGKRIIFERSHVRKDSTTFPVEVTAQLIHIMGAPYILAIDRDITVQKQAQYLLEHKNIELTAALEEMEAQNEELTQAHTDLIEIERRRSESEERYQKIMEASPVAFVLHDNDLRIISVSRAYETVTGITPEEVLGKRPVDFMPPGPGRDGVVERLKKVRDEGVRLDPLDILTPTRDEGYLRETILPIFDSRGKVTNVLAVLEDITLQKKTDADITLFKNVVESAPDGIQIVDLEGWIVYSNKAVERIYGFSHEELIGKRVDEMNADPQFAQTIILPSIQETGGWSGEVMVKHTDGHTFPIWLTTSMIMDQDNQPMSMVGIIADITKQKKAEYDLRESEEKFRAIFNNAMDGILVADVWEKRFLTGNETICRMLGYTLEEIERLGVHDIHPEEALPHVIEEFERQHRGEITIAHDLPVKRKDGTVFHADISSSPVNLGGKTYMIGIFRDITLRKSAQEDMMESEMRYQSIFENSTDLIQGVEPDGEIMFVNKAWKDTLGYTDEDIGSMTIFDIVHPDYMGHCKDIFGRVMKGERAANIEVVFVGKDGDHVLVEGGIDSLMMDGKVVATYGIFHNVTGRKEAEERFKRVFETSNVGIVVSDSDGRIIQSNPAFQEMMGYSADELDREFRDVTHPDDRDKNLENFNDLVEGRRDHYHMEKRYIKKDGGIVWADMAASAVRGPLGDFLYSFGMVVDITDRKKTEGELMDYARRLDESNRLKELFIDTLRHDLMNPLQVMVMYLDMLADREGISPDEYLRYTTIMEDNVKRSMDLLEDASTYAKIDTLEDLNFETLDLGSILWRAIKEVKPLLGDRDVDAELEEEFVLTGNKLLYEVFINLLSNAAKYSPVGSPIEAGIKEGGDTLTVYVKDQGEGVPDEDKEIIFQRLERGTRKGIKGSGLGLAIAKRIVEMHGGRIWVEDNPVGGSIFYVSIPKK